MLSSLAHDHVRTLCAVPHTPRMEARSELSQWVRVLQLRLPLPSSRGHVPRWRDLGGRVQLLAARAVVCRKGTLSQLVAPAACRPAV